MYHQCLIQPNIRILLKRLFSSQLSQRKRLPRQNTNVVCFNNYNSFEIKTSLAVIAQTWTNHQGAFVFSLMFSRPIAQKELVLFKTLILFHKILREGHPKVILLIFLAKIFPLCVIVFGRCSSTRRNVAIYEANI